MIVSCETVNNFNLNESNEMKNENLTKYNEIVYTLNELNEGTKLIQALADFLYAKSAVSDTDPNWNSIKSVLAKVGNSAWSVEQTQFKKIDDCMSIIRKLEGQGIDGNSTTNEQGNNEYKSEQRKIQMYLDNIDELKKVNQILTHATEKVMSQTMLRGTPESKPTVTQTSDELAKLVNARR